jgi:predicted Zn-dependent peptidase
MNKRILAVVLFFLFILTSFAQVDRSKRPAPGPAPKIEPGAYETFTLDNGLQVFIVNNEKLPVVNFRLVLDRDPVYEGPNTGYITIAGDLLRTGTKNRTKDQIDEDIDFIGASLSTGPASISGSSLKKHSEKLLEIISDIVLNHEFKQEELDKLKKQYISGITANRDDPNEIANNVENALVYGKDHPYGEIMTEESVGTVTLEMCQKYIDTYFKPNIGYLALVGDITRKEAEELINKYFGRWQKGNVPEHNYKNPVSPDNIKAVLVNRPAAVQSVIAAAYPIYLKLGDPDYLPANLMNTILGGNSNSRLFASLREKKAYTYGAYSSLNTDKLAGSFDASLQARNEVTDSAVAELLNQMKEYRDKGATAEELKGVKNFVTGSFARSLENPQTIASFAINTAIYKLPEDYYTTYLKRVADTKLEDVNSAIKKYITPEKAYIIVVGKADDVKAGLSKIAPVTLYDIYGNETDTTASAVPEGLTGDAVLQKYIEAIGGEANLRKVQDRQTEMTGRIQNFEMKMTVYQKAPNLLKQVINMMGMETIIIFDGQSGVLINAGNKTEYSGADLKVEATMNLLLEPETSGIKYKLTGTETVEGKKAYKVDMFVNDTTTWTQYYDAESGLKIKDSKPIVTPQGTFIQETEYSDYREVEGVKYPYLLKQAVGPQKIELTVTSIEVNTGLTNDFFKIPD